MVPLASQNIRSTGAFHKTLYFCLLISTTSSVVALSLPNNKNAAFLSSSQSIETPSTFSTSTTTETKTSSRLNSRSLSDIHSSSNNSTFPSAFSEIGLPDPLCHPESYFIGEPVFEDCLEAAKLYKADPLYEDNLTYTVFPARVGRGADRLTPLWFLHKTCLIYMHGLSGSQDERFSLQSQWPRVSNLFRKCLVEAKPGHKYGGIVPVGTLHPDSGFFLSVGTEPSKLPLGEKEDEGNGQVLETTSSPIVSLARESNIPPPLSVPSRDGTDSLTSRSSFPRSSTNLSTSPAEAQITESDSEPECFQATRIVPLTADCLIAAQLFKQDPFFRQTLTYSEDYYPGNHSVRTIPLWWEHKSCNLALDAVLGAPDEEFSLEEQWPKVTLLFRECLFARKPGYGWGGTVRIGSEDGGFFLRVQWQDGGAGADNLASSNGTGIEMSVETS